MTHPIETRLLPLLQGVRKAPARDGNRAAWRARCPLHDRPNEDLSVGISGDDAPLLHCFCRHDPGEVLDSFGIDWTDLHPRTFNPAGQKHAVPGNGGPLVWAPTYSAAEAALRALEKAFAALASADPPRGHQEFEEYLSAVFEAADQIQQLKKAMRAAVTGRGGVAK